MKDLLKKIYPEASGKHHATMGLFWTAIGLAFIGSGSDTSSAVAGIVFLVLGIIRLHFAKQKAS